MQGFDDNIVFPQGDRMPAAFSDNFSGEAWLKMLVLPGEPLNCPVGNVSFAPKCRNNWHKHPGGQILLVTGGNGWYQEEGKAAQKITTGDVVQIHPNVKHWHGAAKDSHLVHLSIETNVQAGAVQWLEPVADEWYDKLD